LAEAAGRDTLDRTVFLWVVEHRVGWLDPFFIGLSFIGYAGLVWIALAPSIALLARRHVAFSVSLTAACVWSADLIALGIKAATGRPRPFETIPQADKLIGATVGQSMPSGHAATSFAGAVVLTYLLPRAAPFVFLLAVAIAFSRVYVGVHYLSDVLAGAALGTAVALAGLVLVRARRRTSAGRPRSEGAPPAG
jgi:undecaprenyl-diphosphatase